MKLSLTRFKFSRAAFLSLLLAGCAMGPNYKRPEVSAPPTFRGDNASQTNSLGDLPWWELFRDPTLRQLIRTSLTNNFDIRIAAARVEQARAVWSENRAGFFPAVGYQGAVGGGRNVQGGVPANIEGKSGAGYEFSGNVSWELDIWGKIRRLNESARALYFSTVEARNDVMTSLIATVASDYFQLLAYDQELKIARDTTNSFSQSLKIFADRQRGGISSKLETAAAEAEEASAAATVPELEREIEFEENQLRILLGMNPGPILARAKLLEEVLPPDVPPGLPSSLLERRPDIREAEQQVRSANAQIGVARANYFPQLNLTGLLGDASAGLTGFTTGNADAWELAANLAGPVFEGGLLKAQYQQARAAWQQTVLQYQSTVINAFAEVSDALSARAHLARERVEQQRAVNAYETAVEVANQRYAAGQANYYELLQEQQLLFPAENALTQTELNQLLAIVQLYRALGGGWMSQTK